MSKTKRAEQWKVTWRRVDAEPVQVSFLSPIAANTTMPCDAYIIFYLRTESSKIYESCLDAAQYAEQLRHRQYSSSISVLGKTWDTLFCIHVK